MLFIKKMITFIAQQFVNEQFRIGPNLTLRRSKFETLNLSSQKKGGSHSFWVGYSGVVGKSLSSRLRLEVGDYQ